MRGHWGAASSTALIVLTHAAASAAYCRTRTCNPALTSCATDANGCISEGEFLHWPSTCISYAVHEEGSARRGISHEQTADVARDAYRRWLSVDCGGNTPPGLQILEQPAASCGVPEYNRYVGNSNTWMYRDTDWPYAGEYATLALTIVSYVPTSGEIVDVDVEINSHASDITVGDQRIGADLDSIITHEAGHFLGLSHTRVPEATMGAAYRSGQTHLRSLEADDAAGLCAAFPPASPTQDKASCQPRNGFSSVCGNDAQAEEEGCSVARVGASPRSRLPAVGLLAMALVLMRRRRVARG